MPEYRNAMDLAVVMMHACGIDLPPVPDTPNGYTIWCDAVADLAQALETEHWHRQQLANARSKRTRMLKAERRRFAAKYPLAVREGNDHDPDLLAEWDLAVHQSDAGWRAAQLDVANARQRLDELA